MSAFKHLFQSSQLLLDKDLDNLCAHGKVLEKDQRGIKVVQLTNGDILKIFRARNLFSATRLYSHARRFCRNDERLAMRDIPTVRIKSLYHFKTNNSAAVLYSPLEGETLSQLIHRESFDLNLAEKLGDFLTELHQKGMHFHSLHTGNIVQTPEGHLGLIDISDLTIYAWPLFCSTRATSFKRLCRNKDDIKKLGLTFWNVFQDRYFEKSQLSKRCMNKIRQVNNELTKF
jgi:hypothetical protein